MNEGNSFKAKITTGRGNFEFEGNQDFVEKQIAQILAIEKTDPAPLAPTELAEGASRARTKSRTASGSRKVSMSQQPKVLNDLIAKDQIQDLKSFVEKKAPESHMENYAVIAYWLKEKLDITELSIDEMWTAYKVLGLRAPSVPIQTFRDGKSKKSFFESASEGKYYLTTIGETFVEHDLPGAPKQK